MRLAAPSVASVVYIKAASGAWAQGLFRVRSVFPLINIFFFPLVMYTQSILKDAVLCRISAAA